MNKENNDIINKFLLIGDKFIPELHLYQPKIGKYSACGPFTKHKKRIDQFMKDGKLIICIKINWIKLVFNMMLHTANIKI